MRAVALIAVVMGALVLASVVRDHDRHGRRVATARELVARQAARLDRAGDRAGLEALARGVAASGPSAGLSRAEVRGLLCIIRRTERTQ